MEFVHKNTSTDGKFELYDNGNLAGELHYNWIDEHKIEFDHTEVKDEFKGKGLAKMLVVKGVEFARSKNLKVVPVCPYVVNLFVRSNDFDDVKA
ncbi:MAG: N-acetyltransferase [Bacteroidales bacterium]|nr:N-acetyltransferase [Bacteroidales bacterium]